MEQFLNRTWATLATGINNSALSMDLIAGQGARLGTITAGNYIRFDILDSALKVSETIYITAIAGDTATIERGKDGTTAISHSAGDIIKARIGRSTFDWIKSTFALVAGSVSQVFSVAAATDAAHAVRLDQLGVLAQNSQSADYTLVLADGYGKHLLHPSADTSVRTFTIPANASVAFPIGTAIQFVNQAGAGVLTIAITTDTMRLAGAGTTGSRTLAANGVATILKVAASEWIISGVGLS